MKYLLFLIAGFCLCSCQNDSEQEPIIDLGPRPYSERETLKALEKHPAFIDVAVVPKEGSDPEYFFVLELESHEEPKILSPVESKMVCEFYFTSGSVENCPSLYHYLYLQLGNRNPLERVYVAVSGEIKASHQSDELPGAPFILNKLEKITHCQATWAERNSEEVLTDIPWRFVGFIDNSDQIYSHPACEDQNFQLFFRSEIDPVDPPFLIGDDPAIKYFFIKSSVWVRQKPGSWIKVYTQTQENKIAISTALFPLLTNPGPAILPSNNYNILTREVINKYDSLQLLLRQGDEIEYNIKNNLMKLYNPKNDLGALFVKD
ncbi:hypothetical protein SAMN00777080_2080 [Aquiflexum balticum DSM 16537]|uniref:Uncharacterized protein n=1 Tax=Aquiflexum balticum DSM 16537 TaxID=758820 RepID=A0A1W2H4E9_9BACT|nr:hypothetical protein [Aquiflexum balticum]SMD43488.1 hypothetical protein SAMN00777080_2080 [Aquiflexum balticum DSM 16537]